MGQRCKGSEQGRLRTPRSARIVQSMLAECEDPSRLLELYYFSREPDVLDIMRAVAAMPEEARASLEAFLAMSHEPTSITARWDAAGRLTLASPQVGQAAAIISYCAENDDGEKPILPN
jgi:hypothetical protein